MTKFEILQELPICDTKTGSEPVLLEKMVPVDFLDARSPQTFNLFLKKMQYLHSTIKRRAIK